MSIDPATWARIEAILDEALDEPPDRRDALIAERCGPDEDVRSEVRRLLAACDEAAPLFETPPAVPDEVMASLGGRASPASPQGRPGGDDRAPDTDPDRGRLAPGAEVGAYRIEGVLGRGGMGVVYLARRADGAFDRKVALKVVKRGMDTDEVLERFRRERSIVARLNHRSIATLLDGGVTPDGLPFFVMEWVRGEPIDAWCARRGLDVPGRLRLVLAVCEAVSHAHRALVVHRDLKPGNILVLPDGQPKLLDFGIAKVLEEDAEDADLTRVMGRRLTPDYAAPEQIAGEPTTTATDVYALGVVLYELLAGCHPFRTDDAPGRREPPSARSAVPPPSRRVEGARARELRGDLDAIVLQAMREEPERRYASVEALARDLRRALEGHPVEARPDSAGYRLGKFVRRNRVPVALGTAAALALVVGTVSTARMAWVADRERAQRELEAERARAARDFVVELFAGLDPDRLEGRTSFTRDELIELGIRNLDGLDGQPLLRAGVLNTLGQVAFNLGDRERAAAFFGESHELLGDVEKSLEVATAMRGLGEVSRARLDFADAERWFRRAVSVQEELLPAGDRRRAEARTALAFALYNQGEARWAEAESLYVATLSARPPPAPEVRARISEGLGDLRLGQGDFEESERLYRRAIEERRGIGGPRDVGVARILWGVGRARSGRGDEAGALAAYGESMEILTSTYGPRHPDVALTHYFIGVSRHALGRYAAAASSYAEAGALMEALNPPGYLYTGFAWQGLGRAHEARGDLPGATRAYRAALAAYRRTAQVDDAPDLSGTLAAVRDALARTFEAMGRPDSAAVYRNGGADPGADGGTVSAAAGERRR